MASGEQNITALPVKTNTGVANSDYFMGIDSAEGYQILIRDVAKYIMENYNGSTLAGSAQTPKAAIDALNSKLVKRVDTANDLTTLLNGMSDNSSSFALFGGTISALVTNNDYSYTSRAWILKNNATVADILINTGSGIATHNIYLIRANFSNNAWSYESTKVPSRQEFNSLNSKQTFNITASTGTWSSELTLQGASYAQIIGNTVMLNLNLKIVSSTKKSLSITGVIPQNMRPRHDIMGIGGDGDTDGICQPFTVNPDGSIRLWNSKTGTSYLQGEVTYLVNTEN